LPQEEGTQHPTEDDEGEDGVGARGEVRADEDEQDHDADRDERRRHHHPAAAASLRLPGLLRHRHLHSPSPFAEVRRDTGGSPHPPSWPPAGAGARTLPERRWRRNEPFGSTPHETSKTTSKQHSYTPRVTDLWTKSAHAGEARRAGVIDRDRCHAR